MISNDHSHNSMINNSKNTMAHSSTPQQPQDHPQQQQQQSLKCPRCDSANTKFCYYNNYSLSQPRHFCKACKRYWTRGGTLRNVPVGGGCRKNKRLKRPSSSSSSAAIAATSSSGLVPSLINSGDSHIDQLTGSNPSHVGSSLFYGHHEMSLPFSSARYEQPQHHLSSALGLGFSNNGGGDGGYQSSLLSSYGSIFGGSSSPTIASLLASKFSSGAGFQALAPFEELNIAGINGGHGDRYNNINNNSNKQGVKLESDGQGRSSSSALGWINGVGGGNNSATNNQTDQIGLSSDPSLYWPTNPTAVGGGNWLDPMANLGSNNSVPSLI